MKALAVVEADRGGIQRLRSETPLIWRPTPECLYLVSGAAAPLGGDDLTVHIRVAAGASLTVRTTAAQVVLPDRDDRLSRWNWEAAVGAGSELRVLPEPTVLTARARHRAEAIVRLDAGARLQWREVVVLGRHGEPGGVAAMRLRVELEGRPIVHHELSLHPAALRGARVVGLEVSLDPAWGPDPPSTERLGAWAWRLPSSGPATCTLALGAEAGEVLDVLDGDSGRLGAPATRA